ncbi:MAG: hypothetical protein OJI67_14295, partial [Prosthecobacter sp.]|nr:hypothetical protein [Prosthecobacter sp.]
MLTLRNLLATGFFPKELPPAFSTTMFANAVTGQNGGLKGQMSGGSPNKAEMCVHNMVRSGGLRRHLGIPNPVHYSRLSSYVVQNWNLLKASAEKSPFSLTQPVDTGITRAISGFHGFAERTK